LEKAEAHHGPTRNLDAVLGDIEEKKADKAILVMV